MRGISHVRLVPAILVRFEQTQRSQTTAYIHYIHTLWLTCTKRPLPNATNRPVSKHSAMHLFDRFDFTVDWSKARLDTERNGSSQWLDWPNPSFVNESHQWVTILYRWPPNRAYYYTIICQLNYGYWLARLPGEISLLVLQQRAKWFIARNIAHDIWPTNPNLLTQTTHYPHS